MTIDPSEPRFPSFGEALRYWLRLGCISFGGPAGQIAIMHRELVERRRWISEGRFLHALNFCMLLPGPEAQQLATYLGWRLHGWRGGVAAGALFVLPSALLLYLLSWIFVVGGSLAWLAAVFYGLQAAVIALVADAVLRIGGRALRSPSLWAIAAASFVAINLLGVSFVAIIASAAALGWFGRRLAPAQFAVARGHGHGAATASEAGAFLILPPVPRASWRRSAGVAAVCLTAWWLPILALGFHFGVESVPFRQGLFFSKAALLTFGGAYAVLPYVAQQAVEHYGWLTHAQMMTGLALAETTPGPLIMVLQFVGFVGGWQHPGPLAPLAAATIGAAVTTWATFLPCFLFVFLGAPHVEHLQHQPGPAAALSAVTAAVVGVVLNLAVVFAAHALRPDPGRGVDWFIALLAVGAFVALRRSRAGLVVVVVGCALAGLAWRLLIS